MTIDNLCDSCTNIGCEFQSGIIRTECAFYMPPHMETDNCGNYIVMQSTYETRLKADIVDVLDKIRVEIKSASLGEWYVGRIDGKSEEILLLDKALQIIDKYRGTDEITKHYKKLGEYYNGKDV